MKVEEEEKVVPTHLLRPLDSPQRPLTRLWIMLLAESCPDLGRVVLAVVVEEEGEFGCAGKSCERAHLSLLSGSSFASRRRALYSPFPTSIATRKSNEDDKR